MEDIRLGIALIVFVSIAMFCLTYRLLRDRSKIFMDFIAIVVVVLIVVYVQTVWGQLWIVQWIPLPSVIVLSNWFPPLLSTLAASVWLRLDPAPLVRRVPVMVVMLAAAMYSLTYFIPSEPPECGNEWSREMGLGLYPVCLQTTPHTCSAAAAATILSTLGFETSEQEMAELCLTKSGTTWLGLYHGLSTKLLHSDFQVEFFEGGAETLRSLKTVGPVLLCCRLDEEIAELKPEYVDHGGWIPGLAHSVVYFGEINERHVIGDPSRGYESWSSMDLNALWTGTGLKITRRPRAGAPRPDTP